MGPEDEDYYDFEDEENDEETITGYECAGCDNVQSDGFDCNKCGAFGMCAMYD